MSDIHEGTILLDRSALEEVKRDIMSDQKRNRVAILGDLAESITITDPRYHFSTMDKSSQTPLRQYLNIRKYLTPFAHQILVINEGNHDSKLDTHGQFVKDLICEELGIPYGTYTCKLSVTDNKNNLMYKAFLTHGFRSVGSTADDPIRQESNMKLQLKRHLSKKAADCACMFMGHTHKLLVSPPTKSIYLRDDGENIVREYTKSEQTANYIHQDHRWYGNTGSFMKLYEQDVSGYAEKAGYDPAELGYLKMIVRGGEIKDIIKIVL